MISVLQDSFLFQRKLGLLLDLRAKIAEYENFPKKGILFRDFSPLLLDPAALSFVVDEFSRHFHPNDIDVFAGIESRGFILATLLATKYNKGILMIRKAGKLPSKKYKAAYKTEYGKDTLEIQSMASSQRVLICDDLLATGGTAKAAAKLVEKAGCSVTGFAFIIELTKLGGIKDIEKYNCKSLVRY